MEVKKKNKSTFSAISINRITAERFREYSKTVSRSHSETLDTMMDFFEKTNITPSSEVMISFIKFQLYMVGRLDYIIEILRDHELKYHKPTHDMLKSLFEGKTRMEHPETARPKLIEPKFKKLTREEWNEKEKTVPKDKYDLLKEKNEMERRQFIKVLDNVHQVKPRF